MPLIQPCLPSNPRVTSPNGSFCVVTCRFGNAHDSSAVSLMDWPCRLTVASVDSVTVFTDDHAAGPPAAFAADSIHDWARCRASGVAETFASLDGGGGMLMSTRSTGSPALASG